MICPEDGRGSRGRRDDFFDGPAGSIPGEADAAEEASGLVDGVTTGIGCDEYFTLCTGLVPAGTGSVVVRGSAGEVRVDPIEVPGTGVRASGVPEASVTATPTASAQFIGFLPVGPIIATATSP